MKVGGPPGEVGVGENNGEAVPALVDIGVRLRAPHHAGLGI